MPAGCVSWSKAFVVLCPRDLPPRDNSPTLTLALVSIEILRHCSSCEASRCTRARLSKMASVSLIFFKRFGLLDASQPIPQPIQEPAKGPFVGKFLRRVFLVLDQSLSHGFGRHPRVRERGLELRVDLGLRINQRSQILR